MAGLTLREGIWYITYRVGNQPRRKSTGCAEDDELGAEIKKREFEKNQMLGKIDPYAKHRGTTLAEHVKDFHEFKLARGVTAKQANGLRMRLTRLFAAAHVKALGDISESRIQVALAKLRKLPQTPKKDEAEMPFLSARTRNTYLQACLSFCRWLVRNKRMEDDPLSAMQLENEDIDVRRARTSLTDEEFARLFTAAQKSPRTIEGFDGPTRAMAYLISVSTGLRRSELASLTPASFHLGGDDPYVVLQAAFSKHRRRDLVPIPKSIVARLQKWLTKMPNDRPVFPRLAQRKTHKMVARDLASAQIPYRTPDGRCRDWHGLRHTFVTRAWRSGTTANLVRTLARHSDLRETMRYSHSVSSDLRAAVDRIPPLRLVATS